jgi:hypothetical protein
LSRCGTRLALATALAIGCGRAPPPFARATAATAATALQVTPGNLDGRELLAATGARAQRAGAGPLAVIGADLAAEGERIGAFVTIPDGECALAYARGSASIVDIDLYAYEDDGSAFATDESPAPEATILICPPHPRRLYVAARVMGGKGLLALGVQSAPRAAAAAVAKAAGARGLPGEDSGRLDAWPGLEARVRAHRRAIGARWDDARRVTVPLSPRAATRLSAPIEAGRCLDVHVSPSDEIASLELIAEDAAGRVLARGRESGRDRAIVLCSASAATVGLALRPRSADGIAVVTIGRSPVGGEAELNPSARVVYVTEARELEAVRRDLEATLRGAGYAKPAAAAAGMAKVGARVTAKITLPPGCARLDVLAGKPLVDVSAALWDDQGALLAEARGGAAATLFPCGHGGAARLDVEAIESPGAFAVELRRDATAPPLLVSHPVAAARLLARLAAGRADGEALAAAAASSAVLVALDETSRKTLPLPAATDGCIEVIVALDNGGSGIDLCLVGGASGEGAVVHGRRVASELLCGASASKPSTLELRLDAGKASALVLARVVRAP